MTEVLEIEKEAEQLRESGKYEESIAKLNELLEKEETFVRAHLALSVLYERVGKHEQAVQHAERAVELEPDAFNFAALSITYQKAFEATRDPVYIEKAENAKARGGH